MNIIPKFNEDDFKKFKRILHNKKAVIIQTFPNKNHGSNYRPEKLYGHVSEYLEYLVKANNDHMTIAMMVNEGKERNNKSVTRITSLYADFDSGNQTKKLLLKLPIKPHMIVETSPNKFHVYWLIVDCDVTQFSGVMKDLAISLGSDPSVSDPSRVMRFPGTINWKYKQPFLARIVHLENDIKPISLSVFLKLMGLNSVVSKRSTRTCMTDKVEYSDDDLLQRIKESLEVVSADGRNSWLKVGQAIHSRYPNKLGYKLFTDWSKKSIKFDEIEQRKLWREFKANGGVTIDSLFWLAKISKQGEGRKFDESSLAKLFSEAYKDRLRFDQENRNWYYFNGVVWVDDIQSPVRCARELMMGLSAGNNLSDIDRSIYSFNTVSGFKAIVNHAELLDEFKISSLDFDQNPNLFAVKNGVINLETGVFRVAVSTDFLRRQANVEFDLDAKSPKWNSFMKEVACRDRELYEFIRRTLGYILFGTANLQIFILIIGSGGNGKGVMMRILKSLLGNYGTSIAPNLLTSAYGGNANAPTPALAVLCGPRLVICTEMSGNKLDEGFIKQFAGGDEITARHGYGSVFTFKPVGKLVVSVNYKDLPEIAAHDEAMWRRLVPIPFNAVFVKGKNDDIELENKLTSEFPGILNWLIKGAVAYNESIQHGSSPHMNGLGSCSKVDDMKLKLRRDADSILAWMAECCDESPQERAKASDAYISYTTFMAHKVRKALSVQAFSAGLEQKQFFRKETSKYNCYVGFKLKP